MSDAEVSELLSDPVLSVLFGGIQLVTFGLAVYLTVRDFVRTKDYGRTILLGWLWMFLWSVVICLIVPLLFGLVGFPQAGYFMPEGPLVVGMAFMGWVYGVIFAVAIFMVMHGMRGFQALRARMRPEVG